MTAEPGPAAPPTPGGRNLIPELFQLTREVKAAIDRELSPHSVTTQQAALVLITHLRDGCGISHLADALGADVAGVTRLVDRLEAKGIVARGDSPVDRRAVLVKVTPRGDHLTPDLRAGFLRAQHRLLAGFEPEDIERFHELIARLRQNLAAAAEPEETG